MSAPKIVATVDVKPDPYATVIRMPELEAMTGLARPLSNITSKGAPVGWVLGEVQDWVRSRIAIRDAAPSEVLSVIPNVSL